MDELTEVRVAERLVDALALVGANEVRLEVNPSVPVPPQAGFVLVAFAFPELVVVELPEAHAVVALALAIPEDLLRLIAAEPVGSEAARETASAVYRMALRVWRSATQQPEPTPDIPTPDWYQPDAW